MSDTVILGAARTPHGALLGGLADVPATELGATAAAAAVERAGVHGTAVEWVGMGQAIQAGVGQVPARQVGVDAGLPDGVPATTVNEASGSGLRALALAADRIDAGRAGVALAGGMESMSNAPHVVEMRRGRRHGDATLADAMVRDGLWDTVYDAHMGELTERLVERHGLTREAQDRYALESNRRAARAVEAGAFDDEIVPVGDGDDALAVDEGPRPDTDTEQLGELAPAFAEEGTVTAGNASGLSDGAGAVVLATRVAADDLGAEPRAELVDYAVHYRDPQWFGLAVGDAVADLLAANDLAAGDVDRYEINEAFAAPMLRVRERLDIPAGRFNPDGGAIALGHPIGASGAILTTTLLYGMERAGHDLGVVGMSIGGGRGIAALLRRE
ncbi:MAG: acetyl-CoA C-acyltransferase [Halobacteriaceae archaeon]